MKVLIVGGSGSLGMEFYHYLSKQGVEVLHPGHIDLDIENINAVRHYLSLTTPDWVINCAALLTPRCEEEPYKAYQTNAIGELNLAHYCKKYDIPLIYISTNYVFDGTNARPYTTADIPNPINTYGKTKLAGELMTTLTSQYYIVRVCGLFGIYLTRGKKMNFADMVVDNVRNNRQMKVKDYEFTSLTYNLDLVECVWTNIMNPLRWNTPSSGTYHIVNEGIYTWYTYASEIASLIVGQCSAKDLITPMNEEEAALSKDAIIRPKFGSLKSSFDMPTVSNALSRYLKEKHGRS